MCKRVSRTLRILRLGASSRNEPRESPGPLASTITYPRANESLLGRYSAVMIYFITLIGLLLYLVLLSIIYF